MGLYCSHYVKDTNLKAIHNTKSRKVKLQKLFPLCQRYKFESNSQRTTNTTTIPIDCSHYVKDTNLKAIHNAPSSTPKLTLIVPTMSKIQI